MSADITTSYLGLELASPVIAGSSGITESVGQIRRIEDAGAGAVVLKSVFEEEIVAEMDRARLQIERPGALFPETAELDALVADDHGMARYLGLVSEAAEAVDIPVIASVNCISDRTWPSFAEMIQRAGADALELNIFLPPSDTVTETAAAFEQTYLDILAAVREQVSIPIAVKVSYHFTLLAQVLTRFTAQGADGIVLFNRFFNPDFDLDTLEIVPTNVLSTPELLHLSLRWVAIMRGLVKTTSIAASTGVHDGDAVIKQMLAGADAVQVASALYRHGPDVIAGMNDRLVRWMDEHEFANLAAFRGRLSQAHVADPAAFDRAQFVKNYRGIDRPAW